MSTGKVDEIAKVQRKAELLVDWLKKYRLQLQYGSTREVNYWDEVSKAYDELKKAIDDFNPD
jgi:hypothetical protein